MDFTGSNSTLWYLVIQFGLLGLMILVGNTLRRKIPLFRNTLLPTALIAGFLGLLVRQLDLLPFDKPFLEAITFHMTAIGFIALSLRIPTRSERHTSKSQMRDGINSGAFIVSNYLMQAAIGILLMIGLAATFLPDTFKAAGIILPLGFGQGPGQAYNISNTYQTGYGFIGGGTFGLAIATMGTLWACIGGILYLNARAKGKRKKISDEERAQMDLKSEPVAVAGEIPLTEAVDKFAIQIAFVFVIYFATYLLASGLTLLFKQNPGLDKSLTPLVWGFNFLIGSMLALLMRAVLDLLKRKKLMTRQYTNNHMLNRISGTAFDIMIFASICAIDIGDLSGLWVPFLLLTTVGGIVTMVYIHFMARILYPGYILEGTIAMYGMMTGTVSNAILLLREVDPTFQTPAANNLVIGSSTAIVMGFPMLLMIGLAPQSDLLLYVTLAACFVYGAILNIYLLRTRLFKRFKPMT